LLGTEIFDHGTQHVYACVFEFKFFISNLFIELLCILKILLFNCFGEIHIQIFDLSRDGISLFIVCGSRLCDAINLFLSEVQILSPSHHRMDGCFSGLFQLARLGEEAYDDECEHQDGYHCLLHFYFSCRGDG